MEKEKINLDATYIVNSAYKFRSDIKRMIITNNNSMQYGISGVVREDISNNISWIIHPYLAYIFSFFDGTQTMREVLGEYEEMTGMPQEELLDTISRFIENDDDMVVPVFNTGYHSIPKRFIVEKSQQDEPRSFLEGIDVDEMVEDLDTTSLRQYIPNQMSIMLNNVCVTDCVYCYANKSHKVENQLPFSRVKELIAEASALGMRDVEVGGGEFFIYEHWKELIPELHKYNFNPYISTKHPVTQDIIDVLKENNIKIIQLSIDSVDNEEIKQMLRVGDGYLDRVKQGLELLNKAGIDVIVKPVITKYNDSIESVRNLIDYLAQFEVVKTINVAPGSYSIYTPFTFSTTIEKIEKIKELVNELSEKYPKISIRVQGYEKDAPNEQKVQSFADRGLCSGNMSAFYVLPDGKVTICEQVYWHPFFILGDLSEQSIMEMWNSEKAWSLWNFTQEEVRPESPCKTCSQFDQCRRGKGNCWRLAIAAFGDENYDYPAPNCPLSLPVTRPYFMPEK